MRTKEPTKIASAHLKQYPIWNMNIMNVIPYTLASHGNLF